MLHFDAIPDNVRNLLMLLASAPALKDFALGCSTSLAVRFGHRLSVDLNQADWQSVKTTIRAMVNELT